MRKSLLIAAFLIGFGGTGIPAIAQSSESPSDGLAVWDKIHDVLSHPRCSNCHVGENNRPIWSGPTYAPFPEGQDWKYHGMNINGDDSRIGIESIPCSACHSQSNMDVPHGPPGNHAWQLAPVEMEWFGKSSKEICEALKDPARNGGRSLGEVADHIDHDGLVHWGWKPGSGREPAPYSRKQTVTFMQQWISSGAPCPQD